MEDGNLEPHTAHVAHRTGGGRDRAEGGKGIGNLFLSHRTHRADLLPETSWIASALLGIVRCHHQRLVRHGRVHRHAFVTANRNHFDFVVATANHAQVVFDNRRALTAELLLELRANSFEQRRFGCLFLAEQRRRGEERPHEGRTLHAIPQLNIGRFLARHSKGVNRVHLDLFFTDLGARGGRECIPILLRRQLRLRDKHATLSKPVERIAVAEHVRVGREHYRHVLELAVESHRFVRQHGIERGGLSLLFRAVLGIGLDMESKQLERRHRDVLPHRDGAPSTNGMNAQRRGAGREQIHQSVAGEREFAEVRIALRDLLLPDLKLGQARLFANELNAEVELTPLVSTGQHVEHRRDDVARLEVAAAEAKAP